MISLLISINYTSIRIFISNIPRLECSGISFAATCFLCDCGMIAAHGGNGVAHVDRKCLRWSCSEYRISICIAGANRVFELLDEPAETEEGYVTLVNAETIDGKVQEGDSYSNGER